MVVIIHVVVFAVAATDAFDISFVIAEYDIVVSFSNALIEFVAADEATVVEDFVVRVVFMGAVIIVPLLFFMENLLWFQLLLLLLVLLLIV